MSEVYTPNLFADFAELQKQIEAFRPEMTSQEFGRVIEAGDGIARVSGLADVRNAELVEFENGSQGIVFNLEKDNVGIIVMGDYAEIAQGQTVRSLGRIASVPVGKALAGRVVNALGQPIDGKGPINASTYRPIERIAPGVVRRRDVDTPLLTGIKPVDAMTPVGRGQRQLIIGDRQTGKSAIAIDTIINQRGKDVICIYVAVGQKKASIAQTVATLEKFGAMEHTVVVVASADESAALQYIAPYAGCAMGEEIMENGGHALVVYDDLSKHAYAYRQVSLLLRRPPGREAYPGDVFYLHSRLLERAAQMANQYVIVKKGSNDNAGVDGKVYDGPMSKENAKHALSAMGSDDYELRLLPSSGGSLTSLPIIETLLGDVSAYVPTNVISITDGQIYLEGDLFYAGIRPAVNVGISVSRVGGDAQTKSMKSVAGTLRLDMASFRELAAFALLGSGLDKATQSRLDRGYRLQEVLKQPQYSPMAVEDEVLVIYAATNGFADSVPVTRIQEWESSLLRFMAQSYPGLRDTIAQGPKLDDKLKAELNSALKTFSESWS
ncbi:MAG TPA: F0F1 ATP synthase subunit alpha [Anaerolineales bacterium]|nr:F0F1 ATP synthase subunit alpha [Anaerolineales bacterium]